MVLVLMGCGAAVFFGCGAPAEVLAVAFAFGLSVVGMAYAIGGISGCHINPAITLGVWLSKRMSGRDAAMYMLFQVIGALIGSAILYALTSTGAYGASTSTGANAFGEGEMLQAFIAEAVFTFVFVLVVLGATDEKKGAGAFAGLAIGLTLTLVHIVCIPITGTSVNPARSIARLFSQEAKPCRSSGVRRGTVRRSCTFCRSLEDADMPVRREIGYFLLKKREMKKVVMMACAVLLAVSCGGDKKAEIKQMSGFVDGGTSMHVLWSIRSAAMPLSRVSRWTMRPIIKRLTACWKATW